ncbi:hypothetical protein GPEL0_01r1854 [Geoanaerobacter pelophilus]|uniref:Uncharacterized protein n=1 Tax=Geoanaerobacter pelophilus TaxID=60036 RepID=A0ABQ0MHB4_9BACT|nr:hypothetical protein GPEL0_01r1854 [Geoanaerobacter pelophilus]
MSLLALTFASPSSYAQDAALAAVAPVVAGPEAAVPPEQVIASLTKENALLQERLKTLESCSITSTELAARNGKRLKDIAGDVRAQRQGLADFEVYVKWMSGHVAGYSKYLAAGSVAARFAKVLPIPYAGQASMFTKFVSDAAVSLGASSVSLNKYLATSQQFVARVDALDPARPNHAQEVSDLVRFADQDLLKGMLEVQDRLVTTSQLTTSSLSFLESLNHYVGSTDEYWAKTKALLKSDDKAEKSFLSESTTALRNKAQAFNAKFILFDATVKKAAPQIKSLVAYDDLVRSLDPRFAKLR